MKRLLLIGLVLVILAGYALMAMGSDEETSSDTGSSTPASSENQQNDSSTKGEETTEPTTQAKNEDKESAVASAKKYVASEPLSKKATVDRLKSAGYSDTAATYGAENCGADWKQNAVSRANYLLEKKNYTQYKSLEYDLKERYGFTSEELSYVFAAYALTMG